MRPIAASAGALVWMMVSVSACRTFQTAMAPAEPLSRPPPAVGEVPDVVLLDMIRHSELIVLAVPLDLIPASGSLSPGFQLGAKETWYNVKLTVDSVVKGKLGRAKAPDFGFLPATLAPPAPFERLAHNEIVVQYPAVTTLRSHWAAAPPPVVGERAVFLFRRCWNCITVALATGHGPYKASPLVAVGMGSKLAPAEWPRVTALLARLQRSSK
jgi:hypothetical protein